MLNPAQHQFCVNGYIEATGQPLLACSYSNRDDTHDYKTVPLGSSVLSDYWIRIPPNGRVTSDRGDDVRGFNNVGIQYINGEHIYFTRTNMCQYMRDCYNHDGGLDYESCQEYWNTPVECNIVKRFYEDINKGVLLFIYVIAILIILVVVIACLCVVRYTIR